MAPSCSPHGKRTSWCKASLRGYVREVTQVGDPPVIKGPQAAKFLLMIEIADTTLNTRPAHSKRRGLSFHTNRRLRVRAERMRSSSPLSQTAQTQTHPKSMAGVLFQYASKLAPAQTTRTVQPSWPWPSLAHSFPHWNYIEMSPHCPRLMLYYTIIPSRRDSSI